MTTLLSNMELVLGILIGIIGYFLRQKDEAQEKQINLLFNKHDEDAQKLEDLKYQIAANHYQKVELDARFDKLDTTFREVGARLEKKLDSLQDSLVNHITHEEK